MSKNPPYGDNHRHGQVTDRQKKVINRILDAGPGNFEGGLTTRKYVNIAGVSRATAFREIADLAAKKYFTATSRQRPQCTLRYNMAAAGLKSSMWKIADTSSPQNLFSFPCTLSLDPVMVSPFIFLFSRNNLFLAMYLRNCIIRTTNIDN